MLIDYTKAKRDKIRNAFRSGGNFNPLSIIKQLPRCGRGRGRYAA
jgi:hypothetical protein